MRTTNVIANISLASERESCPEISSKEKKTEKRSILAVTIETVRSVSRSIENNWPLIDIDQFPIRDCCYTYDVRTSVR